MGAYDLYVYYRRQFGEANSPDWADLPPQTREFFEKLWDRMHRLLQVISDIEGRVPSFHFYYERHTSGPAPVEAGEFITLVMLCSFNGLREKDKWNYRTRFIAPWIKQVVTNKRYGIVRKAG